MMQLCNNDKLLWKSAYNEEYYGLQDLPAWNVINEATYQKLRLIIGAALPSMAISTINYDPDGKPKCVKWRKVALGNLDPHIWSSKEMFAPMMTMLELRVLVLLAIHHKQPLKSGDMKQASVKVTLPESEQHMQPQTLVPKSNRVNETMWSTANTQQPLPICWKINCKNILYLGLYVDNFVYFSLSIKSKKTFQQKLQSLTSVGFMGVVSHFLYIKFTWKCWEDNHLDAHMSQPAFAEQLIQTTGLATDSSTTKPTPYHLGHPIDNIPPASS
eukprot:4676939-Ditylum_brightwellii.AAC.1